MGGGIQPLKLCKNRVWRTYSGGKLIDEFQGNSNVKDCNKPEEWIGSLTKARNHNSQSSNNEGLSYVKTKENRNHLLKNLIKNDPKLYLGEKHLDEYGINLGILVKLLDSAERLTIQVHPDDSFAKHFFDSNFGKTEAWYVLGGRKINNSSPYILLGFKPWVTRKKWQELFRKQDIEGMIASLHKFRIKPGQVILISGGIPHAIGPGCFLLEIQEPTDYTIRVEKKTPSGQNIPDRLCHQGLGFKKMFKCFKYNQYPSEDIKRNFFPEPEIKFKNSSTKIKKLITYQDTSKFKMNLLEIKDYYLLENKKNIFSILIIVAGSGEIYWENGNISIQKGDNVFLPANLEEIKLTKNEGTLTVIRCFPPSI